MGIIERYKAVDKAAFDKALKALEAKVKPPR